MAEKIVNGVLKNNSKERNEALRSNKGKYNGYTQQLNTIVGMNYNVYHNEKNPVIQQQHDDILRYTHNGLDGYSKELHEKYGIDKETLKYYSQSTIKPSYQVNDYDGYGDYISYMWDVYGMEESYAGHLAGLMNVREMAENLAYDIVPSFEGKTAQDVINEILKYSDIKYAMEGDKVGIVRNINVANAINGVVTTNINNYSGKESRMGLISNRMYASSLLRGAQFNSMRRSKYITPELETLYGNNLNNVYNLSSLFTIDTETGRIADPDSGIYLGKKMPNGNVFDYLPTVIPDFKLPQIEVNGETYDWGRHPNYGEESTYQEQNIENINSSTVSGYVVSDKYQMSTYSEGDAANLNDEVDVNEYYLNDSNTAFVISQVNLIDDISLNKESLLNKTNSFLRKRKINTLISRFHDQDNKEIGITQTAVSRFGVSHGRNLLTKKALETGTVDRTNNYSNPYCRVWTAHHQYSKMKHLIRPFTDEGNFMPISELQKGWYMFRDEKGSERLSDYSVLNKNGMVNITPTHDREVDVKKCMFSIENLAWVDIASEKTGSFRINDSTGFGKDNEPILSEEQRGPNGGRIMWFPPYDLNFQETSQASWNPSEFIGRGEPVYTYTNSRRSGTLDFTILVDHPSVVNYWMLNKKNNATEKDEQTLLRYFAGCEPIVDVDDALEFMEKNNVYAEGATKEPQLMDKEDAKDIIFYTFFPNNFSGVDLVESDEMNAFDYIFGGKLKNKNVQMSESEQNELIPRLRVLNINNLVNAAGGELKVEYEVKNIPEDKLSQITLKRTGGDFEFNYTRNNKNFVFDIKSNLQDGSLPRYAKYEINYDEFTYAEFLIYQSNSMDIKYIPEDLRIQEGGELDGSVSTAEAKKLFLGYEMSVNPISVNKILYEGVDKTDTYFLDKVYDVAEAEKIYGDKLSGFTVDTEVTFGKDQILPFTFSEDKNKKQYCYSDYNDIILEMTDSGTNEKNAEKRIEELEADVNVLLYDIEQIERECAELVDERNGYEKDTTLYNQINNIILSKTSEQETLQKEIDNKVKQIETISSSKDNAEIDKNYKKSLKEIIENALKIKGETQCTLPLYICYNYIDDKTAENDGNFNANIFNNPYDAYIKWKKNNLIRIDTSSSNKAPYSLLKDKNEFCCKSVFLNKNAFWIKKFKCSSDITYEEVQNKREFTKYGLMFGKMTKNGNDTYFVNNNSIIHDFTSKKAADIFVEKLNIPKLSKREFIESGEYIAINKENNNKVEFMYYVLEKTNDMADATLEKAMKEYLKEESSEDDKIFIKKYYKDHKFGKLSEMGVGLNYGMFQLFYTGKLQEDGESYETVQDIIARHNFKEENTGSKPPQYKTSAKSKLFKSGEDYKSGALTAEINWDLTNPVLSYLVDKDYSSHNIAIENHYDMESFGLNSTLEVVKQKVNPDATFSFGEVYAALKKDSDKEKEYVLACERGILNKILKYSGETLEEKVKEAEERIEYLKKVFYPSEEQSDLQITKILTKGTASSHGNESLNVTLSKNRKTTIEKFLKSFPLMNNTKVEDEKSKIVPEEENNIIQVAEGDGQNINALSAKSGRCARTKVVVGKEDITATEQKYIEDNSDKLKEERRKRLVRRYDNERLFFEMLKENDNIAYNRLVDKIKYFSPAFHSITPEGFNARLTFLHQCTRQGPTATSSDVLNGTTAANLAFGRPPFCVLRLGDFLNTKIIIESINITYPDSQWDLNPEGIGVQFMMAKVSMQIQIIGGSDISAPVKRLQNAVSFNYYANTSIYDNRSDIAIYTKEHEKHNILNVRQWFSSEEPKTPPKVSQAPTSNN